MMDKAKSLDLEKKLQNKDINGFRVLRFINNGKSAAVFEAEKDGCIYALKIFDNELIERFGHEIQTKRIDQEIALKNHDIKNLIKIHDGGIAHIDNQPYYYIVMEFINGVNLKEYIETKNCDEKFVLKVLKTLIYITEELISQKQIVHRDIKPENIMVDQDNDIILMDLGVLKLIGVDSFSDEDEKSFVGTLRYAPPEFLRRTEEDTDNGWRAVNVYQIGATLHDLIMGCELFFDKIPYANLVIAIKEDIPHVSKSSYSFNLIQLVRDMMSKDWKKRQELVPLSRIENVLSSGEIQKTTFNAGIEDVLKMRIPYQAQFDAIEALQRTKSEIMERQKQFGLELASVIEKIFDKIQDSGVCSSINKSQVFRFDEDKRKRDPLTQNYLYELQGDLKMGFPRKICILVRMSNDTAGYSEVELLGIIPSMFSKPDIKDPINFFKKLAEEENRGRIGYNTVFSLNTINIFKGIANLDEAFMDHIGAQIINIIVKGLKSVEIEVQDEIQWRENIANSDSTFHSRAVSGGRTIFIDKL